MDLKLTKLYLNNMSLYSLNILTLNGKIECFREIPGNWTISFLKQYIYNNHPNIIKPFPNNEINKLNISLIYNGINLQDDILVEDIIDNTDSDNTMFYSINNNEIKDRQVVSEYSISPYSEQPDIFMDSFEFDTNTGKVSNKEIVLEIKDKILTIEQEIANIKNKINFIE